MGHKQCYEVRNLNNKRVCDITIDHQAIVIGKGDCKTIITANADGTLCVKHKKEKLRKAS